MSFLVKKLAFGLVLVNFHFLTNNNKFTIFTSFIKNTCVFYVFQPKERDNSRYRPLANVITEEDYDQKRYPLFKNSQPNMLYFTA